MRYKCTRTYDMRYTEHEHDDDDEHVKGTQIHHSTQPTPEVIFQQSKILQPCKSNKFVNQTFDVSWSGYYKLTKSLGMKHQKP